MVYRLYCRLQSEENKDITLWRFWFDFDWLKFLFFLLLILGFPWIQEEQVVQFTQG